MTPEISRRRRHTGFALGLMFMGIGTIFLLDQQGIISADWAFSLFWPAVFIFFGLENLIAGGCASRRVWGVVLTGIGTLLLLSHFGILHIRIGFELIWPVILVFVGVMLLVRSLGIGSGGGGRGSESNPRWSSNWNLSQWGWADSNDSQLDFVAIFGGMQRRIASQNVKGGKILAVFGGFNIDLSKANIEGDTAVIEVVALFGGGEIRVPDTWIIDIQAVALLGGYGDETHQQANIPNAKRLVVKGFSAFGGVSFKN